MAATSLSVRPGRPGGLEHIGDRYLIERVLGRGGVGEVLAVREPVTGKQFALKRLLPGAKPRQIMLLSREFHTLASLKHPNIIRAFDYGSHEGAPYYTMELLAGSDVEALAPLAWTAVVPILRGVASALSVLHARHLVHRDVGARNVWRTPEGVVKLIDFGTMTNFGPSTTLAGTPPYMPPEALRTHVLDQRSDLYALGALGYYLLTGRHAHPARNMADLEQHWAEGAPALSRREANVQRAGLPPIPELLEQLIDALLAFSPEARPSSSAEVLERLEQVLPGGDAGAAFTLEGVLASKAFVGRDSERARLRDLLQRSLGGRGANAVVLGPARIGRSRLLTEFGLEARLAGAQVIGVASDGDRGALSTAARATHALVEAVPSTARSCAAAHARVLGRLSEELRVALGVAPDALEQFPELHGEARMRLQTALHAFWLEVTAQKPVVLLLDDLQAMDEASLGLFTSLAREATRCRLLIVAALSCESNEAIPGALLPFTKRAANLQIGGLAPDESLEMLRSIFGDAEHLGRTATYLAEQADSSPGRLMELCEYLVHSGRVRCIDGAWVLPQEVSELAAPASTVHLDEARLRRLSDNARDLAGALSVLEGAAPLELCSTLSPLAPEQLFAGLDELCAAGVLLHGEPGYTFRSDALRAALLASLDAATLKRAHQAAGEALLEGPNTAPVERMRGGVHLLRGGDFQRGAVVMNRAIVEMVASPPDEHLAIAQLVEQAYTLIEGMQLNAHQRLLFVSVSAWSGYFADRRLGLRYGDQALADGEEVCGMNLARRLTPWLGKKLGLIVALLVALSRNRRQARRSPLVPDFAIAMQLFVTAAATLSGMHTICLARDKILACARAIEPLAALGPDHAASIVHRFCVGCAASVSDAVGDMRKHWEALIARLDDPRPIRSLPDAMRLYYRAACMYLMGNTEAFRDKSATLEIADKVEHQPIKMYRVSAGQMRAVYLAHQGQTRAARRCKAQVETLALQRGMTWQVEVWEPCSAVSVAVRQRDVMALKRAAGKLRQLSASTPSLRDYVDIARGAYLNLRGRYAEAAELLNPVVKRRSPEIIGYANLVGLLAHAYNALGRFEEAARIAGEVVARLTPSSRAVPGLTLRVQIELALARAGLGQLDEAAAQLDALISEHSPQEGALTLGALHDARASVALRARQEDVAHQHVQAMERWYRATDCPALIQHCDRIARRWSKRRGTESGFVPSMSVLATISESLPGTLQQESAETLIAQITQGAMAREGVLVFIDADGRSQLAKSRADALPQPLVDWIDERMRSEITLRTETEEAEQLAAESPNVLRLEDESWQLFLLVSETGSHSTVVGAITLCNPMSQVPLEVLRTLARHLQRGDLRSTPASNWS
jgi:tetratricopeptide (TPR) repeat protein